MVSLQTAFQKSLVLVALPHILLFTLPFHSLLNLILYPNFFFTIV